MYIYICIYIYIYITCASFSSSVCNLSVSAGMILQCYNIDAFFMTAKCWLVFNKQNNRHLSIFSSFVIIFPNSISVSFEFVLLY